MTLKRRSSGLALVALATCALSLSCTDSGSSDDDAAGRAGSGGGGGGGTGGASTTGGATGIAGTMSAAGTTAVAGTTSTGGSGGAAGAGGSTGGSGGASAGTGGAYGGTAGSGGPSGGTAGGGGTAGKGDPGAGGSAGTGVAGAGGAAGGGTLGPSAGCGMPTSLMSGRASIDVAGKMREYILQLPDDYDPSQPYKLVFGWHPWGGSAQQTASGGYFGLRNASDGQAILVAPEGQDYEDNGLGWGNEGGEDIDFLHAMLDRFDSELCIDRDRTFSTGFSFGAMFSFTLACTANSRMRAIAPQAGNATTSGRCEDGTRAVATMAFIGTDDTLINGHRQAVRIFAERNGCSEQTMPMTPSWCDEIDSMYQPCSCVEYQGCNAGYPVIECEYTAGHIFAPSAGETMWSFFSQF